MGSKTSGAAKLWRERVLAQQASGQSVRGWCQANGCSEHGFYWWRASLGLSPVSVRQRRRAAHRPASVGFARVVVEPPVPVAGPASAAEPLRLTLAGGRELTLPATMPVEYVARLIRAIEGNGHDSVEGAA